MAPGRRTGPIGRTRARISRRRRQRLIHASTPTRTHAAGTHQTHAGSAPSTDSHSLSAAPPAVPSPSITPMNARPSKRPCAFLNTR